MNLRAGVICKTGAYFEAVLQKNNGRNTIELSNDCLICSAYRVVMMAYRCTVRDTERISLHFLARVMTSRRVRPALKVGHIDSGPDCRPLDTLYLGEYLTSTDHIASTFI